MWYAIQERKVIAQNADYRACANEAGRVAKVGPRYHLTNLAPREHMPPIAELDEPSQYVLQL